MDEGFTVATIELDGSIGSFNLDLHTREGMPLLVHAYLPEDAALRFMWSRADLNGTKRFLKDVPKETHFLFISYGCECLPKTLTSNKPSALPHGQHTRDIPAHK